MSDQTLVSYFLGNLMLWVRMYMEGVRMYIFRNQKSEKTENLTHDQCLNSTKLYPNYFGSIMWSPDKFFTTLVHLSPTLRHIFSIRFLAVMLFVVASIFIHSFFLHFFMFLLSSSSMINISSQIYSSFLVAHYWSLLYNFIWSCSWLVLLYHILKHFLFENECVMQCFRILGICFILGILLKKDN